MSNIKISGNLFPVDKVINIAGFGPKGNFSAEDIENLVGFAEAATTEKTHKIIYESYNGKNIVVLKPLRMEGLNKPKVGAEYSFLTKMLIKKLNDKGVVDLTPPPREFSQPFNNRPSNGSYIKRDYKYRHPQSSY